MVELSACKHAARKRKKGLLKKEWVSLLDIPRLSLGYSWGGRNVSKIGHDSSHWRS
jgi:hypothetical protein